MTNLAARLVSLGCAGFFIFVMMGISVGITFVFLNFNQVGHLRSDTNQQSRDIASENTTIQEIQNELDNVTTFVDTYKTCMIDMCTQPLIPCWDALNNDPVLASGTQGNNSQVYVVCVPGNTTLDGANEWQIGQLSLFAVGITRWLQIG